MGKRILGFCFGVCMCLFLLPMKALAADADEAAIAAQQKAWEIINTYADPAYFLNDINRDSMTDEQYEELRQVALTVTQDCNTQYERIKEIVGYVAGTLYYDRYTLYTYSTYAVAIKPYEVYTQKRTICEGYANLVETLCISIGIPCMTLYGYNHAYNAVYDSEQQKWIFADATACSLRWYNTSEDREIYGEREDYGYDFKFFDLTPEEIAKTANHEVYYIDGLLDGSNNTLYYTMNAQNLKDWTQTEEWYLQILEPKEAKAQAVEGFAGLQVKGIDYRLVQGNKSIELDLSEMNLTEIKDWFFDGCTSLEKLILPDCMEKIGKRAFDGCTALRELDLSNTKITSIGEYAFLGCSNLTTVTLPETLTELGAGAFSNCTSLCGIDLSQTSIQTLGLATFNSCSAMTSIIFPKTLTALGENAMISCESLGSIDLSQTRLTQIGTRAFYDCRSLTTITLPSTVTEVGDGAFYMFNRLETTVLGDVTAEQLRYPDETVWGSRTATFGTGKAQVGDLTCIDGKYYFYENGVMATSKEAYVNGAWRWFDADGSMAVDKDVYLYSSGGKWVRYNEDGEMIKGEDYRYGGWYYFEPITGTMMKGPVVLEDGRKVFYDTINGQMLKGEHVINGETYVFDENDGHLISGTDTRFWVHADDKDFWYENWQRQGWDPANEAYRGKEIYDPASDAWYWLDNVAHGGKAVSKDVYQESYSAYPDREDGTGKWVRYDGNGHMVKGWQTTDAGTYYFESITGAMAKGNVTVDGVNYYFDVNTGILQW